MTSRSMNLMWSTVPAQSVRLHVMRTLGTCILHTGREAAVRKLREPPDLRLCSDVMR